MLESSILKFRKVTEKDKGILQKLILSFPQEDIKLISNFPDANSLSEFMTFYYCIPEDCICYPYKEPYIGLLDGDVVCFGCLTMITEEKAYLEGIMVRKDKQGQKIGTKLMQFLEERARENKAKKITLEVFKHNSRAIKFYEKLGYKKERETKTSYVMVKELSRSVLE